jgi:hypothetical protein
MATTRPDNADSSPAPATPGAGWHALSMSAQYQLHAHLGSKLQAVYQPVVEEPVPGALLNLLEGLQRKEKER